MDRRNPFYRRAALVVQVLPHVARREEFALKGGTAINLFLRDLPRLSVDIDLTYLPLTPREEALPAIRQGLDAIGTDLRAAIPGIGVQATDPSATDALQLTLALDGCRIKIEVSPVARGTVWPTEMREVVATVEESLGYSENRLLSFNDVYAGKMCAALDRQHPRDLFDIALLLDREGIGRDLLKTFLVYLIGHNRPIAELLAPRRRDIAGLYDGEFREMAREPVPLQTLLDATGAACRGPPRPAYRRGSRLPAVGKGPEAGLVAHRFARHRRSAGRQVEARESRSNERSEARGCAGQAQAGPWQVASLLAAMAARPGSDIRRSGTSTRPGRSSRAASPEATGLRDRQAGGVRGRPRRG